MNFSSSKKTTEIETLALFNFIGFIYSEKTPLKDKRRQNLQIFWVNETMVQF